MKPEAVLQFAEESLDVALGFYRQQGVPLSYRPRLHYIEEELDGYDDCPVGVLPRVEDLKARRFAWHNIFARDEWRTVGLSFSDKALREILNLELNLDWPPPIYERFRKIDADIFILSPYVKYFAKNSGKTIDSYMVHEVWHLLEQERKVHSIAPLITEGTATLAERLFLGWDDTPEETKDPYDAIFRFGAASVARECLPPLGNPFEAMLDPNVRENIQRELIDRCRGDILEYFRWEAFDRERTKKVARRQREGTLTRKFFENGLTPQGIAKAYREVGAPTVAQELEGQDLTTYIESLKLLAEEAPA